MEINLERLWRRSRCFRSSGSWLARASARPEPAFRNRFALAHNNRPPSSHCGVTVPDLLLQRAVWSKRLEEGSYAVPFGDGGGERRREITVQELGALLSGIDLSTARRRKRYQRANA